jgi:hypothetical protein
MSTATSASPTQREPELLDEHLLLVPRSPAPRTNTALTRATYDVDGGQQLLAG